MFGEAGPGDDFGGGGSGDEVIHATKLRTSFAIVMDIVITVIHCIVPVVVVAAAVVAPPFPHSINLFKLFNRKGLKGVHSLS